MKINHIWTATIISSFSFHFRSSYMIYFHISLTKNTLCAKNFPSLCITRNFSMCTATLRDISTLHVTSYKMSLMVIVICPIHTYPDIFGNILSPFWASVSKISTQRTVFENLHFCCLKTAFTCGRKAKTEKWYPFSKTSEYVWPMAKQLLFTRKC